MVCRGWMGLSTVAWSVGLGCVLSSPDFDPEPASTTEGDVTGTEVSGASVSISSTATGATEASDGSGSGTGTSTSSGTSTGTTGMTGTTGTTETGSSTLDPSTSGSTTGGVTSSSTTADGTTTTTTGEGPGSVEVEADIATCVLLANGGNGYAGPSVCEAKSSADNGTAGAIVHDTSFSNQGGGGRASRILLRFPIPGVLAGKTVTTLSLAMRTTDAGQAGGSRGELRLAVPFDDASLQTNAPNPGLSLANGGQGISPSQWVTWQLDPGLAVPNTFLHLTYLPVDNDGSLYWGEAAANSDVRPGLTINYE